MPEFSNNAPKTADTASFKDYDIMFYKKLAVVDESNVLYRRSCKRESFTF